MVHTLPQIMVAPNGAKRTKRDHTALPITIPEITATAKACFDAGAGGIHAHVRHPDTDEHILDVGLYRELITELKIIVPNMFVQISTEAVGLYRPAEQIAVIRQLRPKATSIALRELIPTNNDTGAAIPFYKWCEDHDVAVQHILYEAEDVRRLATLINQGMISANKLSVLYVLGRYAKNLESSPSDLGPFLNAAKAFPKKPDWMVCAFGRAETNVLTAAIKAGGKVRVGFENSFFNENGDIAANNAERVAEIKRLINKKARVSLHEI